MTKDDVNKILIAQGYKVPEINFAVYYYDCPDAIRMAEPKELAFVFPSIRAVVAYMDSMMSDIIYYDVVCVNDKVDCPFQFMNIV